MSAYGRVLATALVLLASPAAAGARWTVDYTKSRVGFAVQWSGEPFSAEFKRWNADIVFDPNDIAHAHVAVAVELGSEASDEADFDSGLKGTEGFDTSLFPIARFETKSFSQRSPNNYVAQGTLTIRGITRDISLPFTLAISGRTAHMAGTAHVLRTDFGVGRGEWAAPTPVSHDVTVSVNVTAMRQDP